MATTTRAGLLCYIRSPLCRPPHLPPTTALQALSMLNLFAHYATCSQCAHNGTVKPVDTQFLRSQCRLYWVLNTVRNLRETNSYNAGHDAFTMPLQALYALDSGGHNAFIMLRGICAKLTAVIAVSLCRCKPFRAAHEWPIYRHLLIFRRLKIQPSRLPTRVWRN